MAFLLYTPVSLKSLIPKPYDFEPLTFGDHIRKRRLILGITQEQAATHFGVTATTVFNWENRLVQPEIQFMPAVIEFLGYDPEPPQCTTVADRLLAKRRALGVTQRTAARYLGVDPSTWSSWESGGTIMAIAHRELIAQFIGLPETVIYRLMKSRWNEAHGKSTGDAGLAERAPTVIGSGVDSIKKITRHR